ncbi:hypothetical protein [Bradyrhizobium sp. BR 10289]|uniref:hypothetical protein n=1 Tax=Bradyrhizobium sp. BR 10289 TaxID=2749993 RepID=UPI001C64C687|nr:hypothetical protein [Bradyrhizobium sp. BR 10289]MBW7968621.1 hypothetical protein [Bradyrhizobium sp. BR 10289]
MEILISVVIGLALMELYAWLDPLAKWIVKLVARSLPDGAQADFIEQFTADLDALPNSLAKLFYAVRDCALSRKSIQEAAYRNVLSEVTDQYESLFEKIARIEPAIDESRVSFDRGWGTALKFVEIVADSSRTLKTRLKPNDPAAQLAVENFDKVCAPLVEYFSLIEATFERNVAAIRAHAELIAQPYSTLRPLISRLRERLYDPRPLEDEDERLFSEVARVTTELAERSKLTLPKLESFPPRPDEFTDQLKAVGRASDEALRALS